MPRPLPDLPKTKDEVDFEINQRKKSGATDDPRDPRNNPILPTNTADLE